MKKVDELSTDIKNGTRFYISCKTSESERPVFVQGIKLATGSMWHHEGTLIKRDGKLKAFEEGTIHGAIWTDFNDYLRLEAEGKINIAYKNLKIIDTAKFVNEYNDLADKLVGRHFYNLGIIPKIGIRNIVQQLSDWCNYIGIKNEWDYRYRTNPEKYGFVCSLNAGYFAYKLFNINAKNWMYCAPDDNYKDCTDTMFVQP